MKTNAKRKGVARKKVAPRCSYFVVGFAFDKMDPEQMEMFASHPSVMFDAKGMVKRDEQGRILVLGSSRCRADLPPAKKGDEAVCRIAGEESGKFRFAEDARELDPVKLPGRWVAPMVKAG